jgi:hypothetical protein
MRAIIVGLAFISYQQWNYDPPMLLVVVRLFGRIYCCTAAVAGGGGPKDGWLAGHKPPSQIL